MTYLVDVIVDIIKFIVKSVKRVVNIIQCFPHFRFDFF